MYKMIKKCFIFALSCFMFLGTNSLVLAEEDETTEEYEEQYEEQDPQSPPSDYPEYSPEPASKDYYVVNFVSNFGAYGGMNQLYVPADSPSVTLPSCGFTIPDMSCNGYTLYMNDNNAMYRPGDTLYVEADTVLYPTFIEGNLPRATDGGPDAYIQDGVVVFRRDDAAIPNLSPSPSPSPTPSPSPSPSPTPTPEPKETAEPIETAIPEQQKDQSMDKWTIFVYAFAGLAVAGVIFGGYMIFKNGLIEEVEDDDEYEDEDDEDN